jgi:hypothetical protein
MGAELQELYDPILISLPVLRTPTNHGGVAILQTIDRKAKGAQLRRCCPFSLSNQENAELKGYSIVHLLTEVICMKWDLKISTIQYLLQSFYY